MKKVLLILWAVFFSSSTVYAVDSWNAVDDFSANPAGQTGNEIWTFRQGGQWNSPPIAEGELWEYKATTDPGTSGYGLAGRNEFISAPKNGWGGCGLDEFACWTPMVRWTSPIAGRVQVDISVRQQDAASSRPHMAALLLNDVPLVTVGPLLQGTGNDLFISEQVNVVVGDRVNFKIVANDVPYYCFFKETISDANAPKTRPLFYAYKNAVQTIPAHRFVKVTFDALEFNYGETFDLPNSKWVPGQVGVGYISAAVFWTGDLWSGQDIEIHIFKNGNYYRSILGAAAGTGGNINQIGTYVTVDRITDYFEIYLYQNVDPSKDINNDRTSVSWFSGQMVKEIN